MDKIIWDGGRLLSVSDINSHETKLSSFLLFLEETKPPLSIHHIRLYDLVNDSEMAEKSDPNPSTSASVFTFSLFLLYV